MGGEDDAAAAAAGLRKTYWRSASWSSSRTDSAADALERSSSTCPPRRFPPTPLTPRSQNSKARSCLPPLQPLSITRRSLDEWPRPGSDDVGEWPQPPTPSGCAKPGDNLKLDLSSLRSHAGKDRLASFDKECSKVAEHIYLGGDSVARNREILRQNGITHVLNCVGFVCPEYFKSDFVYKTLWLQDSPTEDITSILYDVFDYFEDVREQGGRVFVHCCQGVSRSTSLVIAYRMWREGQSFDDAFEFVKAARGIANPNMGFACQLLQCQKRVHAIPLSPNSVLRMYRMAPHSPYDALHLVPKMLNDPSPAALDSRGAFIIHVFSSIYVWIGKSCHSTMEKDAKAAAFQVVRYERVKGAIAIVEEGEEPLEFWEAFSNAPLGSDAVRKVSKEEIESAKKVSEGKRRVESYNGDFELFYKAITGGVVPPFSSLGAGQETHIPARESNWSILRRKFISGAISRVYSDSVLARDGDARMNRVQLLSSEAVTSPPYPSPSSLSSDSSNSSKSSSESPLLSPSTSSSPSLTSSPPPSNLPESLLTSSKSSFRFSSCLEPSKSGSKVGVNSPPKGFAPSIAERRGSFSPLKLSALTKDVSLPVDKSIGESSASLEVPREIVDRNNDAETLDKIALDSQNTEGQTPELTCVGDAVKNDCKIGLDVQSSHPSQHRQPLFSSTGSSDLSLESPNPTQTSVYRWPKIEKISTFCKEDLDSEGVFLFLTADTSRRGELGRMLYIWIGSDFELASAETHLKSSRGSDKINETDWTQVGSNFLAFIGLQKNIPIKVVKEQEPREFLEFLNSV